MSDREKSGAEAPKDIESLERSTNNSEAGVQDEQLKQIASRDDGMAASIAAKDEEKGEAQLQQIQSVLTNNPNAVNWEGADDPANPMNWTEKKKWMNLGAISIMTLLTPLGSSMFAPGVPEIMRDFDTTSPNLATFVVSVYVLGFAFGPLLAAPMSEMYGRAVCYNVSNLFFFIFTIATALSTSMPMMIIFRFLMGFAGSTPITNGSGSISDMFPVEQRGKAMSLWAMGPLLGPCLGPVAGGFVVQHIGWRWVFWIIAIASGVIGIGCFFMVRETFPAVLLRRKAASLRKSTGNPELYGIFDDQSLTQSAKFRVAIIRPLHMLFTLPSVFILSLYLAMIYGTLFLLFSTFTFVYAQQYGFSAGIIGLAYLPTGMGMFVGVVIIGYLTDKLVKTKMQKGLQPVPEDRMPLWLGISFSLILPISLFWYGWTVDQGLHWIVPMIGTFFFSFGLMGVMMCIQTYLVDAYIKYAASVVAALTVLRSIVGALLPLAGLSMYNDLGLGWGNSVLAFIALAMVPVPILFRLYGSKIRERFPLKV